MRDLFETGGTSPPNGDRTMKTTMTQQSQLQALKGRLEEIDSKIDSFNQAGLDELVQKRQGIVNLIDWITGNMNEWATLPNDVCSKRLQGVFRDKAFPEIRKMITGDYKLSDKTKPTDKRKYELFLFIRREEKKPKPDFSRKRMARHLGLNLAGRQVQYFLADLKQLGIIVAQANHGFKTCLPFTQNYKDKKAEIKELRDENGLRTTRLNLVAAKPGVEVIRTPRLGKCQSGTVIGRWNWFSGMYLTREQELPLREAA